MRRTRRHARRRWLGRLAAPLALAAAAAAWQWWTWPDVGRLATQRPASTAFIERWRAAERAAGRPGRVAWSWVPYEAISPHLKRAVLVAEDINFFSHAGFDLGALREAVREALEDAAPPRELAPGRGERRLPAPRRGRPPPDGSRRLPPPAHLTAARAGPRASALVPDAPCRSLPVQAGAGGARGVGPAPRPCRRHRASAWPPPHPARAPGGRGSGGGGPGGAAATAARSRTRAARRSPGPRRPGRGSAWSGSSRWR
jgi:hypothetical protein